MIIKVLSIDGGGVRGIIPARILQEIEKRTGKYISELFDIVSGTSTGGLLALGIVKANKLGKPEFSAQAMLDLYMQSSKKIFTKPSVIRKIKTGFGLWGSKYDRSVYDKILSEVFTNSLLSETICPVFIPIYSLENFKPFISGTYFAANNKVNDFYLSDIAAATSAAPTYFDPRPFRSPNGGHTYQGVDGGIYANNPELIGVTGVYLMHPNFEVGNIILLSLGTGDVIKTNENNGNNGDIGWLKDKDIIGDMIDAESALAETAITAMLKKSNHFRFQLNIPNKVSAMDNSSSTNLKKLLKIAENFILENSNSIDDLCRKLT
jgi:patatin-like phospholipase/acyl hydrolase